MSFKNYILNRYKGLMDNEEEVFRISTGLKFLAVSLVCAFSVTLFTYILVRINLLFFVSHGYPGAREFVEVFYEFIYSSLSDEIIWIFISSIFIFFLGYYLAVVVTRPFKAISTYCENQMSSKNIEYSPDFFSDLKLLTSFSAYFFLNIDKAKQTGKFEKLDVPSHFTKIHKPIFEKNFFFNYLFVVIIFGLLSSLAIVILNTELQDQFYALARKFLSPTNNGHYFLDQQIEITEIAVNFFITLHLILYFLLGVHLYSKVATPAFAVFATMRSFSKGHFENRIHLIGFYYLREDCRKINKYLDYVQKNLT